MFLLRFSVDVLCVCIMMYLYECWLDKEIAFPLVSIQIPCCTLDRHRFISRLGRRMLGHR